MKSILFFTLISIYSFSIQSNAANTFPATGNVGMGTATPLANAHVTGPANSWVSLLVSTPDYNYAANTHAGTGMYFSLGATAGNTYGAISSFTQGGYANGPLGLNPWGGNVGVGIADPKVTLDVAGGVRAGSQNVVTGCNASLEGTLRYNYAIHNMEFCNGYSWQAFGSSAAAAPVQPGTWCGLSGLSACGGVDPAYGCPAGYHSVYIEANGFAYAVSAYVSVPVGNVCIKN